GDIGLESEFARSHEFHGSNFSIGQIGCQAKFVREDTLSLTFMLISCSSPNIDEEFLTRPYSEDMKAIFENIGKEYDAVFTEFNGEEDHVHMLIHYPPKVSLAK